MTGWDVLAQELAAWEAAGRHATLWWRDDDAALPSAALSRLLALSRDHGVPLALAVIPAEAGEALAAALAGQPLATPLQHGYAHRNHARDGSRNGELGPARPVAVNADELAEGARRMAALFGAASCPVLVPPWNRIDPALVPLLPGLGFAGLSTYGPRPLREPAPGLVQANTHLDIVDWRNGRGFIGEARALERLAGHLRARRTGAADGSEPSGLLTHHLAHDAAAWRFIEDLLAWTRDRPPLRWLAAPAIFPPRAAPEAAEAAR